MAAMNVFSHGPLMEEGVSAVTLTNSVALGTRRVTAGEEYVYMFNAGGATASVKSGVKFVTGASGYSFAATSITDTFNPCCGVIKHADVPSLGFAWVLVKGFASVLTVTASTADAKMLALGAAGSFIEASGTTTLGTATKVGFALSHNTGAGGTIYAFINPNV